jgi:hypothetical protein
MNEDLQRPEEPNQESADSTMQFEVSIGTDRDHFLRRTCPSCGIDFKRMVDQADFAWLLIEQIKRWGLEFGAVPVGEEEQAEPELQCPYCRHVAKSSEMHTEETVDYFKRFVYRECVVPMLNNTFSELEDSIGRGHSSGGFLSISVSFEHQPIALMPRPIHGPDAPDMKIVQFLCCDKHMKINDSWDDVRECIYCRTPVAIV